MMNNLFTYVLAMKENIAGLSVLEETRHDNRVEDDGHIIENSELVVRFENGVILRKQTEVDQTEPVNDEICAECWITYEVLSQPEHVTITPNRKSFTNQCQENFWLKINQTQTSTHHH
ncbi:hypothetical protein [Vibrio gazogenes]|uniref:Uncharacterized protein n=1 Tax=Vibrio gazogenes DSM 21264 = NBRC 103151 TaxID=1123492 RepID=A0A1M4VJ41_VIBGA|nr:hypothetical protein [Vibrio gazogenes]USP15527.1 hypothetical protein MKS89_19235 [Vibrio gazogenes]SHE69086.1 hypothetical protein SAMN02745781_00729 [Vibrio gazogenes DSM 21264] [Vibrio gazogenes DSM 21264 = NBRC 103151]SJN58586.1 hypothetical protein BQ6471_03092 [Vibrio gazogenes]